MSDTLEELRSLYTDPDQIAELSTMSERFQAMGLVPIVKERPTQPLSYGHVDIPALKPLQYYSIEIEGCAIMVGSISVLAVTDASFRRCMYEYMADVVKYYDKLAAYKARGGK